MKILDINNTVLNKNDFVTVLCKSSNNSGESYKTHYGYVFKCDSSLQIKINDGRKITVLNKKDVQVIQKH